MNWARLSPDGHAVAFASPAGGIQQVFLMLTTGGEPLQLTNDEGDKWVDNFSPDGKEVYYGRSMGLSEIWGVPTLGGAAHRVAASFYSVPSPDGLYIYYWKLDNPGIFRAEKSGLNEELVYRPEDASRIFNPILFFPNGSDLLADSFLPGASNGHLYNISSASHKAVDLGEISLNPDNPVFVWAEPGKSILLSRTVNGLTNIWEYSLQDRSFTQVTFGPGPDTSPMSDPTGKGIYYVNGKSSGFLTVYRVHSKESTDIASEDATQPVISPDGKRVMYITFPAPQKTEVWVSDIEGGNKVKIATGGVLGTLAWAPDNFHLSFEEEAAAEVRVYIVGADGSGLRQLPQMGTTYLGSAIWGPDRKSLYLSYLARGTTFEIWKWNTDGSNPPEKLADRCGAVADAEPGADYILSTTAVGEMTGIYEVSISDRKCIPLLPGVVTFNVVFACDGKSFLYAVASRGEVTIYRQPWRDGKLVGSPQVALKVPFAFPLLYHGNAYDFSRDLSTIVYARPGGHADLYLLSQK